MKNKLTVQEIIIIICIFCFCFLGIYRPIDKASGIKNKTITVTDKAVKVKENDSKYLIFAKTEEGTYETFEITDSLLRRRFDSSDVYAGIEIGKTYRISFGGHRNKLMSWYPNIYEYKLIKEK